MKRFGRRLITHSARRMLRAFAAAAIVCKFLVPIGYMPGSFANGTPFMLCDMVTGAPTPHTMASPEMAPASQMAPASRMSDTSHMSDAGMHGSAAADHQEHLGAEAWEHCPLGALGSGAALAFDFEPAVDAAGTDELTDFLAATPRSATILTARARAPPVSAIHLTA